MAGNLLLYNLVLSVFMTGLIWTVQLVHYPAFRFVEAHRFPDFARFHSLKITPITAFPMTLELIAGILLISQNVSMGAIFNLVIIFLIWGATFAISVPCHNRLALQKESAVIERLIFTNWIRTVLWSFKTGLLLCLVVSTEGVS